MKVFLTTLLLLLLVYTIIFLFVGGIERPTDDSDKDADNRSNLIVHTDYKTGVQYLSTRGGGITPRLDKDGKLVIVK